MTSNKIKGEKKIVGFFSTRGSETVFCDGEACVIAFSKKAMIQYIGHDRPFDQIKDKIKKTTFGEIFRGIQLGAQYALDGKSYEIFFPLAKKARIPNLPIPAQFFAGGKPETGTHLINIHMRPDE